MGILYLDKNTRFCYTYDSLNRVTKRETKSLDSTVIFEESFTYDAAGNITDAPDTCFAYDTNSLFIIFYCLLNCRKKSKIAANITIAVYPRTG